MALAAATFRCAILERVAPRKFSYSIESCFRYRYAEMRMLGRPVPELDLPAQWPEGFEVDRMILPLPDKTTALLYRVRGGGDPFLASRAAIILFSSLSVLTFVPLALAIFRKPWAASAATIVYAGCSGAYSRTVGNYLREDFALPGLLIATAGTVYLLTAEAGRKRWLVVASVSLATFWAGSCWHMTQFCVAVLASLVFAFGVAGRASQAAQAGGALWLGLIAAAATNHALWIKGAMWNVGPAVALAPAAGFLLARILRQESRVRWLMLGAAAALGGVSLVLGRSQDYAHVFELVWAKATHLGMKPHPSQLSPEARIYWVGPYDSPRLGNLALEYGVLALPAAAGLACLYYDLVKRRAVVAGGSFAALATPVYVSLYLFIARLIVLLAPWVVVLCLYPAVRARRWKARAAWLGSLALVWLVHLNGAIGPGSPAWYKRAVAALARTPTEVAWFYGSERPRLLLWLATRGEPGAVLTDFAFSAQILYLAGRPTALHPMFEVPEPRRKVLAYAEAATADEETFYDRCRQWRVKYVVHFAPQVLDHGGGSFYFATAAEPARGSAAWLMQFEPQKLKHLRLVYETCSTRLYEVGRPYDGYVAPAYHPLFDAGIIGTIPTEESLLALYAKVNQAQGLYIKGVAAQAARSWSAAVTAFTGALYLHPDYEDTNLRLGECYLALGRREEARLWLERAERTCPDDARATAYLATLAKER